MKIFKRKHFQALIYSIFLALPLLSVLGRCVYTIVNKNAKDSYYGVTINEYEYQTISSFNELEENEQYLYESDFVELSTNLNSIIVINDFDLIYSNFSYEIPTNVVGFRTTYYDGISYTILRLDDNTDFRGINNSNYTINFNFTYISNTFENVSLLSRFNGSITKKVYNEYSYLDNAFEYSIDRFVSENDYGNFDFFQWFSTFFLSNTTINNLYIHFVNWYLNYILYVSLGYLIFSVLFWFVNFFRRLVEDTQNINVGGM